ncbi:hypothetical protein AXXA_14863 [Achromobacter insuavis AXX-A]|uniref:Uncharacterized protein n=1 Tax=Achromobacter insuavis AXX-A TaxID=1003200 RepID=F7T213_9BURK|nr:hypothetical protein AXXA_14863 [Achromobacter insuavis AXX-A]
MIDANKDGLGPLPAATSVNAACADNADTTLASPASAPGGSATTLY